MLLLTTAVLVLSIFSASGAPADPPAVPDVPPEAPEAPLEAPAVFPPGATPAKEGDKPSVETPVDPGTAVAPAEDALRIQEILKPVMDIMDLTVFEVDQIKGVLPLFGHIVNKIKKHKDQTNKYWSSLGWK